jgi:hypothetical protein
MPYSRVVFYGDNLKSPENINSFNRGWKLCFSIFPERSKVATGSKLLVNGKKKKEL